MQQRPQPHAGEHGEQERRERADQEILRELALLEGLEARQRLGRDDPPHGAVLAQEHEGKGEGALQGADGPAAGDVDRTGRAVLVAAHLQRRQLEHAADQHAAPARDVEVAGREQGDPPPPQPRVVRGRERGQERAHDDGRHNEQRLDQEERAAAAVAVHLGGPQGGGERVREQRHDEQGVHAVSSRVRNILSPAATRGQAMRRARCETALRSTSRAAAAAAGSPRRNSVAVRRCRGVQLQ